MVCLQHRHAVLHSDTEAILSSTPEGVAEVEAGAMKHHQVAFVAFKQDALGLYKPAQRQRRAEMTRIIWLK